MNIISIDTATSLATIAVIVKEKVAAEALFNTDRTLSARLIPEIEHLLEQAGLSFADIDLFAASVGPGSFTGVRGGVATIQGLALATGKPCVGFSSLALLAMNFSLSSYPVCPLLDARKSEVYGALYDCSSAIPVSLVADCVMPPAALLELLRDKAAGKKIIFAGEGTLRYHDLIVEYLGCQAIIAPCSLHAARASHGGVLALHAVHKGMTVAPSRLLPVYLRASEAELNRKSWPV